MEDNSITFKIHNKHDAAHEMGTAVINCGGVAG